METGILTNATVSQELENEQRKAEEQKRKAKTGFLGLVSNKGEDDTEGSFEFSFAGLFKIMCCISQKPVNEKMQLLRIADSLSDVNKRLDTIERYFTLS